MINIFTSIPPAHANGMQYISECVDSWKHHGTVYSVNHPEEIEKIKIDFPDVVFIPTFQTQHSLYGKHLVSIDAIFNEIEFRHTDKSMFINSDCSLIENKDLLLSHFKDGSFTYLHRHNYDNEKETGSIYKNGIDAFLFSNTGIFKHVQKTHFCIGQTYFDLWYPYAIQMAGMDLFSSNEKVVFHKNHKEQYSGDNWVYMGNYCALLMGKMGYKPNQITDFLYKFLRTITQQIK